MEGLIDGHGREFRYLRLSLTEACNFRCSYCLPDGYRRCAESAAPLQFEEIMNLGAAFVAMGVDKIRLTGGEPTLRGDLLRIIEGLRGIDGLREIALTTNGFRLLALSRDLRRAGLDILNVSVDSLRPERFAAITGRDRLREILDGIEQALELGFGAVKINAVLLKGINDDEIADVIEFIRDRPVHWRWIELMRTGSNGDYFRRHFLRSADLISRIEKENWREIPRPVTAGPARLFARSGFRGTLGFIDPSGADFCRACNRLRVTNTGALRLCLFGEGQFSLRPWLASAAQCSDLQDKVRSLLRQKAPSHRLEIGNFGDVKNFAAIGG